MVTNKKTDMPIAEFLIAINFKLTRTHLCIFNPP